MLGELFSRVTSSREKEHLEHSVKTSAMSPIFWISAVCSPACFGAATLLQQRDHLTEILVVIGCLPIIVGVGMYLFFGIFDRDRLHSEDYRIKQYILEMTESKGGKIKTSPVDLVSMVNPYPTPKSLTVIEDNPLPIERSDDQEGGNQ